MEYWTLLFLKQTLRSSTSSSTCHSRDETIPTKLLLDMPPSREHTILVPSSADPAMAPVILQTPQSKFSPTELDLTKRKLHLSFTQQETEDDRYWDLSFNNYNYSYVNTATDKYKYCTLTFDRLGIANSSHGEPLNEIQSFLEVAATVQLTQMLRNGTFPGVNHTFSKVVHVGHSFGSAHTYSLANMHPNLTDGIVLTGFPWTGLSYPIS